MKISELPEDIRKKALEYQRNEESDEYSKDVDDLTLAFKFGPTTEGADYWWNYHHMEPYSPMDKKSKGKTKLELDFNYIFAMSERMDRNKSEGSEYPPFNWTKEATDEDIESLLEANVRHAIKALQMFRNDYLSINLHIEDDETLTDHLDACGCNCMMVSYQLNSN